MAKKTKSEKSLKGKCGGRRRTKDETNAEKAVNGTERKQKMDETSRDKGKDGPRGMGDGPGSGVG